MSAVLEHVDDIRGLDRLPPDALYEVIDGEAKEIPYMGFAANQVAFRLAMIINEAIKNPRDIVVMESLFELPLPTKRRRRPDVAYVPADRFPSSWPPPAGEDPPAIETAPAIVAEVISPSDLVMELEEKRRDYLSAGVNLVLMVYPRFRMVQVFESITANRILTEEDALEFGNVLPGVSVRVGELFSTLNRPN